MNRILLSFFSLLSLVGFAQKPMPSVVMTETNEKIEIDGSFSGTFVENTVGTNHIINGNFNLKRNN